MDNTKNISGIIKTQFPEFYHEEGPVFINFVTAYYDWLESKTDQLNKLIKPKRMFLSVIHGSANVTGSNTTFLTDFSNNDKIAIVRSNTDYELFTIDVVTNNTFLTLKTTKLPKFAITNTTFGNVSSQPNPGYYVRRTQDSLDIDTTTDEFVVWFKETYLKNIQFTTITDTKTFVKNSLDLYRSKGTPRSVDLLFKIAFGVPAEVYYPSQDLFNTSQGIWHIPKYLELAPHEKNVLLENKQIIGLTSGAIAFCDAIVRKTIKDRFIDVAYISAIDGNFQNGEKISTTDGTIEIKNSSLVTGSLNNAIVLSGGSGYAIGDRVDIYSDSGEQGLGRVANVVTATGSMDISLTDGGYAYSNTALVFVANSNITLSNVQGNTSRSTYFEEFETFTQPMANITYTGASATPAIGDFIYSYHANNDQKGYGQIFGIEAINSTAGEFETYIRSGNLNHATIYTTANAESLTLDTYTDKTATGNAIGMFSNVVLTLSNISGTFTNAETIYQTPAAGGGSGYIYNIVGANGTMRVESSNGVYDITAAIEGTDSGATANIDSVDITIGVKDIGSTTFIITANNFVTSDLANSGINATSSAISAGSGMDFSFSNTMSHTEYIDLNTDLITDYLSEDLFAAIFNFPGDTSGNITSNTIANMLTYANTQIGKIKTLTNINGGADYTSLPIIKFYDPLTAPYNKFDTNQITITGPSAAFEVGEVITQLSSDYRGLITTANSTVIVAENLRWDESKSVINTINATTTIVGSNTGASANVANVIFHADAEKMGNNVIISSSLVVANGVINELDIIDSGFGFRENETISWNDGNNTISTASANLNTHGTGRGFYKSKDSFVSNIKKLQDGEYWQTHSYEVRSSVSINKYAKMLKEVVHVAGTGAFGNLVYTSITNNAITQANSGTTSVVTYEYSNTVIQARSGDVLLDRGENVIHTRE